MDIQLPLPRTHIAQVMYGSKHETRQRDGSTTQLSHNGHFTFLEEHSRSSSVYDEIVDSYSATVPKSHQENFSTIRNVSSQQALRHEEWPTRAQSRSRQTYLRPPPRNGSFFDAFRGQKDMAHLKPSPLSVSRPAGETPTHRQSRPRSSSVPLLVPQQTPSLTLFPRIDPAPTSTLTLKPSYPGSDISSSSPYQASSTAVSLSSTKQLLRPPIPPKDSLPPPRPLRKDTPSLPRLKIPFSQPPSPSATGDISTSMRNPIRGPALYTQPRLCSSLPTPTSIHTSAPNPIPSPARTQIPCHHARTMPLKTPYTQMRPAHDQVPRLHNFLASFFTWLLLVSFIAFTGPIFSSSSGSFSPTSPSSTLQPLFITSLIWMAVSITGCLWLGIRWRKNYLWLINRLYIPLVMNGLAGVFATLTGVYGQHGGTWCLQTVVALVVEGVVVVGAMVLFAFYSLLMRSRVRKGTKVWVVGQDNVQENGIEKRGGKKTPYRAGSIV